MPPYRVGHIGDAAVPRKQRQGDVRSALAQSPPQAEAVGLPYVEITTDLANTASQRVILANGGVLAERFDKPPQFGGKPALRFRIAFD